MPWLLVETLLGNVSLAPSDILLKSCPLGHILECQRIASAVPLIINGIEASLDFCIFDVLNLDLLLGSPDHRLRESASTTYIIGIGPLLVKPLPKQDPLEKMMHVSLFTSPEPILIEVVDFSTPHENDSEDSLHLYEGERSSSLSTEFGPLPAGPYDVTFDHDRESISIFNEKSLEIKNSWAMESRKAPTLEFIGEGSADKHGSFILDAPHEPCLHHAYIQRAMLSALSTHEDYKHLLVLCCKMFQWLIMDAYVYHKHIRFRVCIVALTLQLKLH
jgi:hypothetical protein